MAATDYPKLRVNDLVAKVAKVTLKDTTRVLLALDCVIDFLDVPAEDVLSAEFEVIKPSPENAEGCAMAFEDFKAWLKGCEDENWLDELRAMD